MENQPEEEATFVGGLGLLQLPAPEYFGLCQEESLIGRAGCVLAQASPSSHKSLRGVNQRYVLESRLKLEEFQDYVDRDRVGYIPYPSAACERVRQRSTLPDPRLHRREEVRCQLPYARAANPIVEPEERGAAVAQL